MCVILRENRERIGALSTLLSPSTRAYKAMLASFQALPLSLPEPSLSQCHGLCWSLLLPQGEATSLVFLVRLQSLEYQDCGCAPPHLAQWLLGSEPWQQLPRPQAQIREEGRPPTVTCHTEAAESGQEPDPVPEVSGCAGLRLSPSGDWALMGVIAHPLEIRIHQENPAL